MTFDQESQHGDSSCADVNEFLPPPTHNQPQYGGEYENERDWRDGREERKMTAQQIAEMDERYDNSVKEGAPDGVYRAVITSANAKLASKDGTPMLIYEMTISGPPDCGSVGNIVTKFDRVNPASAMNMRFVRRTLSTLHIEVPKLSTLWTPDGAVLLRKLIGYEVTIKIRTGEKGFQNIDITELGRQTRKVNPETGEFDDNLPF